MTNWERIINQPGFEKIKSLYNENFPLEVRIVCANWIEQSIKADQYIDANDPTYEQHAANFINNLIQQLEQEKQKLKKPEEIAIKYRLEDAIRKFTLQIYSPVQLYKHIRDALMYEQHVLESYSANPQQMSYMDAEQLEIVEKLKQLRQMILHNTDNQNRYKHEMEQYMLRYSESSKRIQELSNVPSTPEIEERKNQMIVECKRVMDSMTESINARRIELYQNIRAVLESLHETQKIVIHKRLAKWQRDQALAGNGAPLLYNALDEIQTWFEELADLIIHTKTVIDTMRKNIPLQNNPNDLFEIQYREVTVLLQNLIVSAFIVEKQPPQVMKTHTRFGATIRLLLTNIGIHLNNPFVSVSILSGNLHGIDGMTGWSSTFA